MNTAVAPRPSFNVYPGPVIFPVFAALFLGFTIYIWRVNGLRTVFTEIFIGCTLFMLLGAAITISRYLRYCVTAEIHDHAVVLNGRELLFDRIDSVALAEKARLGDWAKTVAMRRTLTIASEEKRRTFAWLAQPDDPIEPILQLVIARMADEAKRRALRGDGWSLELGTLRTKDDATPLSTVTAAEVFDDEVRLWRRNEPAPFLAVPIASPNALVLLRVNEGLKPAAPLDGFGRLLFVRKAPAFSNIVSALGYGFLLASAAFYVSHHLAPQFDNPVLIASGLVTLGLLVRAIFTFATRYRFHERGIVTTYALGKRELRYADVARMSWKATRNFTQGVYSGTSLQATLVPVEGRPLHIQTRRFKTVDDDLDALCHTIGHVVEARMRQELESTGRVAWTKNATLLTDGVELKRGTIVRYDEQRAHFDNGYLHIYRDDRRKPLRMLSCADDNFYPGYFLYQRLIELPSSAFGTLKGLSP